MIIAYCDFILHRYLVRFGTIENSWGAGEGGLKALKMTSPLGFIKQREIKKNKGREGGPKFEKNGPMSFMDGP